MFKEGISEKLRLKESKKVSQPWKAQETGKNSAKIHGRGEFCVLMGQGKTSVAE